MGKSHKSKSRGGSDPYSKNAHGSWNVKPEDLEPKLLQMLEQCLVKLKEEASKDKVALSQLGEDLRQMWEKAALRDEGKAVSELLRAGKRRAVTEFVKAHWGGLGGLLKKDSARFEMVGAAFVKLRADEGGMETEALRPGKLLAEEAEEDTGLDVDGIEI